MRFAIFSDVHANLEALEAVLADARERRCTDFVCLGDVVGYNASPRECLQRVRELDCPVVKGNHDEEATLSASSERFNELAEYVFSNLDAAASFTYQRTTVCFFGHTHVPMVFVRDQGVHHHRTEHVRIEPARKYLINAGGVGQPRDGNWHAAYCIYDVENHLVELRRVKYDIATAQKKIAKAGLPQLLAERLALGR